MTKTQTTRNPIVLTLALILLLLCSCSDDKKSGAPANTGANKPVPAAARRGSIRANPNPVQVCTGNAGKTTITWEATGAKNIEIRIGSPDGPLFGSTLSGAWPTGDWVADGQTFYLQDVSDGLLLTKENTLASVVIKHTKEGCK
ncbi:MAG: hypothetical protein DMF61_00060 [Blastocatellia bacterium AA13]|nr:MAG: hypothetical protein DMF61_00060 [Blastocatellia bacterium AA13]